MHELMGLIWLVTIHGSGWAVTFSAGRFDIYPLSFGSLLTIYPVVNRFRLYLQHATVREDGTISVLNSAVSRTYFAGPLGQLFIVSPMIMYHHQHHARPSLPYRALRAVAQRSDDPNVDCRKPVRLMMDVVTTL